MDVGHHPARQIRFADFELDPRAGELCHAGTKTRLGEHSLQILLMLLEEPGEVVTRDELRARLWSSDGSVDFEDGLNHAIRKLREALGDSAQHPRCVETLPRHGYRFIAPVERTDALDVLPLESAEKCQREGSGKPAAPAGSWLAQPLDAHDNVGAVRELPLLQRRVFAVAGLGLVALVAILLRPTGAALSDSLPESGRMSRLAPPLEIESVAVLPLENLSRDPEQEYFSDGMTEELITILAKMGSFGVIGQASVMQYKGTKKPLPQIARELNVDALVEGTVLRSGDRARVTACLVHAATGRQLWAATYESELRDISSSQGQVAQAIAHAIGLRHTNQQQARLRTSRPTTPEAYEAFLKGRHYWDIQMPEGQLKCIEYYKRAIQADGKYALAYAQMAHCYDTLSFWEFPPAREYRQKALDAARKALDLDGSVAEAHLILADQKLYVDWNWSGAEAEFRRAMEMDPSSVDAVCHYGYCLEVLGRFDEAIRVMEAAHRLDPLSHLVNVQLGRAFYDAHQDQRAVEQFQEMIRFEPNDAAAYDSLGSVYESLGRYEEAEKTYLKGAGLAGVNVGRTRDLQQAYSSGGIRGYWKAVLEYEHSMARREHAAPLKLASIYAHLGEKDQAIACLERAYQQHAVALIWLKADRSWDLLRSDARYQNLLRRMNFPP